MYVITFNQQNKKTMKKHILGLMLIGFLAMFSCNKDTELYSDDSIADLILETRGLTNDCFQ
jgi:hypothetical protein